MKQEMAIRADRKNYMMSVELAMQREIEYRKKLQNQSLMQSQTNKFSCFFGQVARPTPSQVPTPKPTSNSYLGPSNGREHPVSMPLIRPLAPYSRPSPSAGPSCSADQRQKGPVPLPEGIFTCKVCQLDCKTGFNLLGHYQGNKHKAKLRGMKGKEVSSGTTPRENEKRPYCDFCGIWCTDEYTYRMHFNCTNHILKQYDFLMKKRGL